MTYDNLTQDHATRLKAAITYALDVDPKTHIVEGMLEYDPDTAEVIIKGRIRELTASEIADNELKIEAAIRAEKAERYARVKALGTKGMMTYTIPLDASKW